MRRFLRFPLVDGVLGGAVGFDCRRFGDLTTSENDLNWWVNWCAISLDDELDTELALRAGLLQSGDAIPLITSRALH